MKSKYGRVDGYVANFHEAFEAPKDVQHLFLPLRRVDRFFSFVVAALVHYSIEIEGGKQSPFERSTSIGSLFFALIDDYLNQRRVDANDGRFFSSMTLT